MDGCEGSSSLLLALGVPHTFLHECSFLLVRASFRVTSQGLSLCAAEGLHSMCDVLLVTSLCVARETSPVLVGVPLSLAQWLLLCCSKGLSGSSLVAL